LNRSAALVRKLQKYSKEESKIRPEEEAMKAQTVKHLVNILVESPFYLTLPRRERHRLITDFIDLYSFVLDGNAGKRSTGETDQFSGKSEGEPRREQGRKGPFGT